MEKFFFDNFNDVFEFRAALTSRPNNGKGDDASRNNDNDFAGMSLTDAYETLTNGIPDVVTRLKREVTRFQAKTASNLNQRRPINYYNGHSPNVPAAIIGLPKSMRKVTKTPSKVKTITLFYDVNVPWTVKSADLEKAGFSVFQLVYWLEKCGYRVRLTVCPCCTQSNGNHEVKVVCSVLLKDFRQPLDMLKLSFPLTSVSMWRRLGFRWIETVPNLTGNWSAYGNKIEGREPRMELLRKAGQNVDKGYYIQYDDCSAVNFDPIKLADRLGIKVG